ncbi:MAG: helix-hairpin-helix domain-containing protein [Mycobacteriales bacterium]
MRVWYPGSDREAFGPIRRRQRQTDADAELARSRLVRLVRASGGPSAARTGGWLPEWAHDVSPRDVPPPEVALAAVTSTGGQQRMPDPDEESEDEAGVPEAGGAGDGDRAPAPTTGASATVRASLWRFDPGRRAALVAVLAALVAAAISAAIAWHLKPVQRSIGTGSMGTGSIGTGMVATTPARSDRPSARPGTMRASGTQSTPSTPASVVVSVVGEVKRPGVYRLATGARVADALRTAGGASGPGRIGPLNLAALVSDGMQIVVAGKQSTVLTGPGPPAPGATAAGAAGTSPAGTTGTIDLNTATLSDLDALPGVGPVTAARILDWRTANGRFHTVDELREVSGIGDAKFAQIAPHVRV